MTHEDKTLDEPIRTPNICHRTCLFLEAFLCQHQVSVHVCGGRRSSCLTCSNKRSINAEQKEKHMKIRSLRSAVSATKIPHPWLNVFSSTCFCLPDSDNNYVYSYFIFASHLLVSEYHVCMIYVELLYLLLYIAVFTFFF